MKTLLLSIPGISCGHCKMSIEKALKDIGVTRAEVNIEKKTVLIELGKVSETDARSAIEDQGYDID